MIICMCTGDSFINVETTVSGSRIRSDAIHPPRKRGTVYLLLILMCGMISTKLTVISFHTVTQ